MEEMTYRDTLERIHSFQRFGSKLGLERITRLLCLIDNPQEKMNVIHIAGTNGKGSVCRYLYSVLQENGYKTGLYTSPFLERFTERIECNGSEISQEDLVKYTERILEAVDIMLSEGLDSPTEFELITAIAFLYFSEQELDFLVLEVGLGGTGDSTNVVSKPIATVITSISYDHMEYLGETLEKIAIEKAGIIKPGIPVIINVDDEGAAEVIRRIAKSKSAKLYDVSASHFNIKQKTADSYTFDTEINGTEYKELAISMIGMHQVSNAICALTVLETIKKEGLILLDREKLYLGFLKAKQTGRFEIIQKAPWVIIDGAHNEAGAEALRVVLREHFLNCRILMVLGMLADKKIDKMIEIFGMITEDFVATEPDNPRKLKAHCLCEKIKMAGKRCLAFENPEAAYSYINNLTTYDVIVFAGSLYLIGKVRGMIKFEKE